MCIDPDSFVGSRTGGEEGIAQGSLRTVIDIVRLRLHALLATNYIAIVCNPVLERKGTVKVVLTTTKMEKQENKRIAWQ
jgi:hypothetical protein